MTKSLDPHRRTLPFLTRSWLLIPAGEDAALQAAARSGADVLVADLASLEPEARAAAVARTSLLLETASTRSGENPWPAIFVLLPPVDEDTPALLETLVPARPDGFVLAGALEPADIQHLHVLLDVSEVMQGTARESIGIAAFLSHAPVNTFAGVSNRLLALGWSAEDLARLLGATRMHDQAGHLTDAFRQARAGVLHAAAQAQLEAIDAASGIFSTDRLARDCAEAAADGFTGKAAWSPRQVSAINHAFSPTPEQLAEARSVLKHIGRHDARTVARARRAIQRSLPERR